MTKSHLELQIEEEKRSVERMRESLSSSQRLADRLERIVADLSAQFEQLDDDLQPFYKTMKSAIASETSIHLYVINQVVCRLCKG